MKGWLLEAFVTKTPEACNCFLHEKDDNDIHMNLASKKTGDSADAMVVEITPPLRDAGWTIDKLKAIVDDEPAYVRVRVWLLLDSAHVANTTHATAWEIHPVTGFEVCTSTKKACDQGQGWVALESYQPQ